jgi:hypothetical protein
MKITRVYSDENGDSHFDDLEIELQDAGPIGHLAEPIPAKEVVFRRNDPDYDYDWHTAPQRQLVVLLDGAIELEVSNGDRRTFYGGDILLLEDTSGRGHRTRNVGPRERHSIFIVLDETPAFSPEQIKKE